MFVLKITTWSWIVNIETTSSIETLSANGKLEKVGKVDM